MHDDTTCHTAPGHNIETHTNIRRGGVYHPSQGLLNLTWNRWGSLSIGEVGAKQVHLETATFRRRDHTLIWAWPIKNNLHYQALTGFTTKQRHTENAITPYSEPGP